MRLLGFAGCKRAGKDSSARFIMGKILQQENIIKEFGITAGGDLLVNTAKRDEKGNVVEGMGLFDTTRPDPTFQYYLQESIWPHVKIYNFADSLKWIAINLYGMDFKQVYGSGDEKQSDSRFKWGDIMELLPLAIRPNVDKDVPMSARQFLQTMGDILRWIDDDCFTTSLLTRILTEQCPFALISDVRRIKEVELIQRVGGKVIYLTRELTDGDPHSTEHEFDNIDKSVFDDVIDNRICSISEKNDLIYKTVKDWGWLE